MRDHTLAERRLLHLLSCALSDSLPEPTLFGNMDDTQWVEVLNIAKQQSIPALIADRILTLPKELLPARRIRLELALILQMIEQGNQDIITVTKEVYTEYEAQGISAVLLKGQTMAMHYHRPQLRSPGDIDLYLWREGDYERANNYAKRRGYRMQGDSMYEQLYWRGRTAVENHLHLTYFGRKRYDEALRQILEPIKANEGWAYCTIDGIRYRMLPRELNAVYCFQHILHHFSYLGIGLRHICDWVLLLSDNANELDIDRFTHYARMLDLLRPMRLFALMTVRHLGINPSVFPFELPSSPRETKLADIILEDIFRGGNFGLETFSGKTFSNIWSRRWFMFCKTSLRSLRVSEISPEHIRLKPWVAFVTQLKLLVRRCLPI